MPKLDPHFKTRHKSAIQKCVEQFCFRSLSSTRNHLPTSFNSLELSSHELDSMPNSRQTKHWEAKGKEKLSPCIPKRLGLGNITIPSITVGAEAIVKSPAIHSGTREAKQCGDAMSAASCIQTKLLSLSVFNGTSSGLFTKATQYTRSH